MCSNGFISLLLLIGLCQLRGTDVHCTHTDDLSNQSKPLDKDEITQLK